MLAEFINTSHHILEHIEIVGFSGFVDAVEHCAGVCACDGFAKQPVFSADEEGFYRALSSIVLDIH